jgi:flagellar basal-body rod modification protein FlgD
MSNVGAVTSALGSAVSTSAASSSQLVSEDTFLKLLVTQLQNQDPLNPQDSAQFVSQLASFSSLEQMSSMNTNMETVLETSVTSLIGKTATVLDSSNSAGYTSGTITGIQYYADGPAVKIGGTDYPFSDVQNISAS